MNDTAPEDRPNPPERRPEEELPSLYCPVCSARLTARSCKLMCTKCGYYMSCSDYV
jgi:hypothetical protein